LATLALAPARGRANPVLGFIEEFPGVSTSSWSGGTPFSNPGAGGYLGPGDGFLMRSEEHTSELQSRFDIVCRLLLEKKKRPSNRRRPRDAASRWASSTFSRMIETLAQGPVSLVYSLLGFL